MDFDLRTISGEKPDITVDFDIDQDAAKLDYTSDDNTLIVKATLMDQKVGQYEGNIIIDDQKTIYHIPVLLRISNGSINVIENNGRLDFEIDSSDEWSYAKISVFNTDYRIVDSISATPTSTESILIHDAGTYWVQAELKSGKDTINLYNAVTVKNPAESRFDIGDIGLPTQPLLIITAIAGVIVVVGLIIRK